MSLYRDSSIKVVRNTKDITTKIITMVISNMERRVIRATNTAKRVITRRDSKRRQV